MHCSLYLRVEENKIEVHGCIVVVVFIIIIHSLLTKTAPTPPGIK
jgi:hypothetical protein